MLQTFAVERGSTGRCAHHETLRLDVAREPHLIADGDVKRCSVCGYPFLADEMASIDPAFAEHLRKAHKPGQTSEDFNQAAARVVREATDKD